MLQLNNRAIISFFLVVASLNSYAQNKEELKQKKEVLEEEIKFTEIKAIGVIYSNPVIFEAKNLGENINSEFAWQY